MIMHFDIRDKVMKILINIDCKVYRICIIRENFCVRNLAKILLLWSLRKLLRWCIERNLHHAFHCTEFVKINHRTLLYEKNSLINRHVTSLLQNGIITILSIKKYSIQRKKISFYVMSTNNFSLIIRVHLHPH